MSTTHRAAAPAAAATASDAPMTKRETLEALSGLLLALFVGLLSSTIVTALGEFGRTPKISTLAGQNKPGRDHDPGNRVEVL